MGLFFFYFILSWASYLTKLVKANQYEPFIAEEANIDATLIVPVYLEDHDVFHTTLTRLKNFAKDYRTIVVVNGIKNGNYKQALDMGFEVKTLDFPDKRQAIATGAELVKTGVTIILDSDTWIGKDTIEELLRPFVYGNVGGVTPKHEVFNYYENFVSRICNWLEDLRFNVTAKGQSASGSVSCLPGRLYAVRTNLLKELLPEMLGQHILGTRCFTGEDRFITSWLLKNNYLTVYQETSLVWTDCPRTLKSFIMQRLRWSRSSFRESMLSIPWTSRYPWMTFTVFSDIILRWVFFLSLTLWILGLSQSHFLYEVFPQLGSPLAIFIGVVIGFFVSGFLRQIPHLLRHPGDILYTPVFLLVTTFILTPVEWFGNLTFWKQDWMTRG